MSRGKRDPVRAATARAAPGDKPVEARGVERHRVERRTVEGNGVEGSGVESNTRERVAAPRVPWIAVLAPAIAAGVALAWLLHRSLFQAHAQSYDTMIYGRALWGVAHGVSENTVLGVHWLAVHANFVLFALAPFTAAFDPASILIGAQAVALAATLALVISHAARGHDRPVLVALIVAFAASLGSPIVLNPFLFDARPDLIGVPLCLAGLLRIHERRTIDARAVLWLFASLLVREEFSMVVAPALVALPVDRDRGLRPRTRWLLALAAVVYTSVYTMIGRAFFGGTAAAERVSTLTTSMFGAPSPTTFPYQGEIVFVALAAVGGLAMLGWRWSAPAWPGLAFLLAIVRLPSITLNAHYALFAAPGLCLAAVVGAQRLRAWSTSRRRIAWFVVLVLSTIAYVASSSAPGGRRFLAPYFDLDVAEGKSSRFDHSPFLVDAHRLVERIPSGAPAAIAYPVAAASLERAVLWDGIRLRGALAGREPIPDEVRWVAVRAPEYGDTGKTLVQLHGFRLVDEAHGWIALFSRDDVDAPGPMRLSSIAPVAAVHVTASAKGVDGPSVPGSGAPSAVVTRSRALGLRVEGLRRMPNGHVTALLVREADPSPTYARRALTVVLQGAQPTVELTACQGILNPEGLPIGRAVPLEGGPLVGPTTVSVAFAARDASGQWIVVPSELAERVESK